MVETSGGMSLAMRAMKHDRPPQDRGGGCARVLAAAVALCAPAACAQGAELVEARRIWNLAPHNAFTDLLWRRDSWWCVFREGEAHVSPDGALRVIASRDGMAWESAALLRAGGMDLRDAKLTVTPDDRFMLLGAGALHEPGAHTHQSYAWFSDDGRNWTDPVAVGDPGYWLWRVTWHRGSAYGIGYGCGKERGARLYSSRDGAAFDTLVEDLAIEGYPNETSIVFLPDDTALCLLRRDPGHGLLGSAKPPYRLWTWKDVGMRIGGPHMIRLPDGRIIAVVRLYEPRTRTSLCRIDPESGAMSEILKLPSGGDTSYAGLAWRGDRLRVSYHSSHETAHEAKTAIYLAEVRMGGADPAAGSSVAHEGN